MPIFTFTFAICRRPTVRLSSVTFVRRTQWITIFGTVCMPFCTLAIHGFSIKTCCSEDKRKPANTWFSSLLRPL